jgi:hypothetical protein
MPVRWHEPDFILNSHNIDCTRSILTYANFSYFRPGCVVLKTGVLNTYYCIYHIPACETRRFFTHHIRYAAMKTATTITRTGVAITYHGVLHPLLVHLPLLQQPSSSQSSDLEHGIPSQLSRQSNVSSGLPQQCFRQNAPDCLYLHSRSCDVDETFKSITNSRNCKRDIIGPIFVDIQDYIKAFFECRRLEALFNCETLLQFAN